MYVCQVLDETGTACVEWVSDPISLFALSQSDAQLIGSWLVSFFVLCCVYMMIVKAIKKS